MKVLICQPKLEESLTQLERELHNNPSVDAVIVPEGYINENVEQACKLAKKHQAVIIGGCRRLRERPKDRAILINREGEVVLDRVKYSDSAFVREQELMIGHILCDELVLQGLRTEATDMDLIVHPIGVGMFSEEQFDEWINRAREIAVSRRCMIVGASHADGSYGNTGISIPIAYCFDKQGEAVFISKHDVRSRILDTRTKEVVFA